MGMLLLTLSTNDGGAMNEQDLSLPKQIGAWRAADNDQNYDRQTLYKYIDGGAELYLAYDFNKVLSRKYRGPENGEIVLDVYDMGSAADAFGLFSSEREDDEADIGQDSEFGGGLLRFWKDHFFVSILASGSNEKADAAVLEIGKTVTAAIQTVGPEPELLKFLPPGNVDKKKIRYFHLPLQLDKFYFVANENILNLNPQTDCLLAEYSLKNTDPIILLLIQYASHAEAKAAYENFLKIYLPEAKGGPVKMENGKWTMARLSQNRLKIVFEAPEKEQAAELLAAVKYPKDN
jgi:hypothetical protein